MDPPNAGRMSPVIYPNDRVSEKINHATRRERLETGVFSESDMDSEVGDVADRRSESSIPNFWSQPSSPKSSVGINQSEKDPKSPQTAVSYSPFIRRLIDVTSHQLRPSSQEQVPEYAHTTPSQPPAPTGADPRLYHIAPGSRVMIFPPQTTSQASQPVVESFTVSSNSLVLVKEHWSSPLAYGKISEEQVESVRVAQEQNARQRAMYANYATPRTDYHERPLQGSQNMTPSHATNPSLYGGYQEQPLRGLQYMNHSHPTNPAADRGYREQPRQGTQHVTPSCVTNPSVYGGATGTSGQRAKFANHAAPGPRYHEQPRQSAQYITPSIVTNPSLYGGTTGNTVQRAMYTNYATPGTNYHQQPQQGTQYMAPYQPTNPSVYGGSPRLNTGYESLRRRQPRIQRSQQNRINSDRRLAQPHVQTPEELWSGNMVRK